MGDVFVEDTLQRPAGTRAEILVVAVEVWAHGGRFAIGAGAIVVIIVSF